MKKIFLPFFIIFVFSSISLGCNGIEAGRDDRRSYRDRNREGRLPREGDRDETISDADGVVDKVKNAIKKAKNYLKECSETDRIVAPGNNFDIVTGLVGLQNNPITQLRSCLANQLESATNKICQQKEDIYALARENRNYDSRVERIQIGIDRVEELHDRHRDWLQDQADRYYSKSDRKNGFQADEWEAYAIIFEQESYINCTPSSSRSSRFSSRYSRR